MRKPLGFAVAGALGMGTLALAGGSTFLFSTNYLPHRYCYLAQPWMVWSNVSMDALIGASYVLIFGCLALVAHRLRHIAEIQAYLWVFISFGIFIVACASTHFMEVVTIWWPIYRLSVTLKILCAVASVGTAFLFSKEVSRIIQGIREFIDLLEARSKENLAGKIEIVQRETRVRETEERLRAILNNVLDSIMVIDAGGTIVSFNPATVKMFEYEGEELVGQNVKLLMPDLNPSHQDGSLSNYKTTNTSKPNGVGREFAGLSKTGRSFPTELTISEIALQGQQMFVALVRDITERKRTENHLKNQAALLELAHDAIIVLDMEGRVIFWNLGAQDLYGWTAEQMGGQILREVLQTRFPIPFTSILAIVKNEGAWNGELRQKTRNSQEVVVTSRWSLQRDELQTPKTILLINRDITERTRAQEVRDRLAAIVDSSEDAIVSKTLEGPISDWNRGAEKMFGYSASEMVGKSMLKLMPADRIAEEDDILARIKNGESVEPFETVRVRKDGTTMDVSETISPIRDAAGVISGTSRITRDITRRKADELEIRKLNEELEEGIAKRTAQLQTANHDLEAANRDLESFSYSVSHDLRTPLRHISGFSRILMKDYACSMEDEAREHLTRIEDAVARMAMLVEALLGLAKLGRRSLQLSNAELNPIVDEVIELLNQDYADREVEWRIDRLPSLECDPILMRQVFQNLLGNALKYSRGRKQAVIEVGSIQRPGEPATIFVRDNGAGFNMNYAQRLFGVFQRLHTESEFEGNGVGLATVQRIIQKHGGAVWAEAKEDRGATFYFLLQPASKVKGIENEPETLLK